MPEVIVAKNIDLVSLWRLLFATPLQEEAVLYECAMRTNYEHGEFRMLHEKEFVNVISKQNRLYIMLRGYTSSRSSIPNSYKAYIEHNNAPRATSYSILMPPRIWVELIDFTGLEGLSSLRGFFAEYVKESEDLSALFSTM